MHPFKTVAFHTLGCKLNFSETATLRRMFEESGFARVELSERPDVVVINTCSVTDHADSKCRNIVRRVKSNNPLTYVMVVGCYAQLKPQEIAQIPGVNVVLGANEKFDILEHLEHTMSDSVAHVENSPVKDLRTFVPSYSTDDRTRSFLKVQDGCDYFCSFCTIPLARGRSRNASIEETLESARKVAETGVREIVLTGVNIGDFGQGDGENLLQLIQALDELDGIERFRISSIEPNLLSNDIIAFVAKSRKFVPHFHIPLQTGSDTLLASMRRRYDSTLYRNRIETIKAMMPEACIGVDVIVGFPGETEAEFNRTVEFIKSLDVSYLHVFTYSERANTTAVRLDDVIPTPIRQERNAVLTNLSLKKKRAFYESQVGTTRHVLWEASESEGMMGGFTENYVRIEAPYDAEKVNHIEAVLLGPLTRSGNATMVEHEMAPL